MPVAALALVVVAAQPESRIEKPASAFTDSVNRLSQVSPFRQ